MARARVFACRKFENLCIDTSAMDPRIGWIMWMDGWHCAVCGAQSAELGRVLVFICHACAHRMWDEKNESLQNAQNAKHLERPTQLTWYRYNLHSTHRDMAGITSATFGRLINIHVSYAHCALIQTNADCVKALEFYAHIDSVRPDTMSPANVCHLEKPCPPQRDLI